MGAVITLQHISPPRVAETMVEATFPPIVAFPQAQRNGREGRCSRQCRLVLPMNLPGVILP